MELLPEDQVTIHVLVSKLADTSVSFSTGHEKAVFRLGYSKAGIPVKVAISTTSVTMSYL